MHSGNTPKIGKLSQNHNGKTANKPDAEQGTSRVGRSVHPVTGSLERTSTAKQPPEERHSASVALTPTLPLPALTPAPQHIFVRSLEVPAFRRDSQPSPTPEVAASNGKDLPVGSHPGNTSKLESKYPAQAAVARQLSSASQTRERPGLEIGTRLSPKYVPPRVLNRVMPDLSSLGASTVYGATDVAVQVKIDEYGRVTQAQALNNASKYTNLVTAPALSAAKQWTFDPAKSRGISVASERTIVFHFAPRLP
jgi:TonB family protein